MCTLAGTGGAPAADGADVEVAGGRKRRAGGAPAADGADVEVAGGRKKKAGGAPAADGADVEVAGGHKDGMTLDVDTFIQDPRVGNSKLAKLCMAHYNDARDLQVKVLRHKNGGIYFHSMFPGGKVYDSVGKLEAAINAKKRSRSSGSKAPG